MCAFVGFLCEVVILLHGYEQDKFYGAPRFAIQASGRPQTHALDRATAVLAIIYLLTYSMEQSPSWEANWFCS